MAARRRQGQCFHLRGMCPGAKRSAMALAVVLGAAHLLPAEGMAQEQPSANGSPAVTSDAPSAPRRMAPILTLNQERLFRKSLFGERAIRERDNALAELARENRRIEAELTQEEKDLTERRKALPAAQFRKLADAFDEKVQGIRKAQDEKARAIVGRYESEQQRFFGLVLPLLSEIVSERGASAIIDSRVIIVATEDIDITDEALRLIDARIGEGGAGEAGEGSGGNE